MLEEASKLELPKEPKLKDPKDFKILGKVSTRPDVPLKTNGAAEFGIDVQLPNMLYATVERCPVLGGALKSFEVFSAFLRYNRRPILFGATSTPDLRLCE